MTGADTVEGLTAHVAQHDEDAALVARAGDLGDQTSFAHARDVVRQPTLLPAQFVTELDHPPTTVGLVGERGEDQVVLVGKTVFAERSTESCLEL